MSDPSTLILSVFTGIIGLIGLFLASRAADLGMTIFGALLALFAIVYIFTAIKRAYDQHGEAPR